MSLPLSDRAAKQTDRQNQRRRETEGEIGTCRDSPSLLGCALLCSPPKLKEERGMRLQEKNKLTMKRRGRSRGWLSVRRERERGVGESLKEAVMAPSIDE